MYNNIVYPKNWMNQEVLITGGTGSLGKQLVKTILDNDLPVKGIRIYSRDELKQWEMRQKIKSNKIPISYIIGDIKDYNRLYEAMKGVDICIHTAALKQVDCAEENPIEYIKTNVTGSTNVMRACIERKIKKAIMISTDKAVCPINLYGATKMTAEKAWLNGEVYTGGKDTIFSVIRYGNVIGSRGSIVDLINKKEKGKKIPVTDPEMTRFWIALPTVSMFILNVIDIMNPGYIYIPKMTSCKLSTFLTACTGTDIDDWKIIGFRPGEKQHENMINVEEGLKLMDGKYYTITKYKRPQNKESYELTSNIDNPYFTTDLNVIRSLMGLPLLEEKKETLYDIINNTYFTSAINNTCQCKEYTPSFNGICLKCYKEIKE